MPAPSPSYLPVLDRNNWKPIQPPPKTPSRLDAYDAVVHPSLGNGVVQYRDGHTLVVAFVNDEVTTRHIVDRFIKHVPPPPYRDTYSPRGEWWSSVHLVFLEPSRWTVYGKWSEAAANTGIGSGTTPEALDALLADLNRRLV